MTDRSQRIISKIRENAITEVDIDVRFDDLQLDEIILIAEALKTNNSVKRISLSQQRMGEEGVEAIARAIVMNQAVTELNLAGNFIGDKGAEALAEALKHPNCKVTCITLSGLNNIGDRGAEALANALQHPNCKLTELYLHNNDCIGDEGARAIANALQHPNCKLKKLSLFANKISTEGFAALEKAGLDSKNNEIKRREPNAPNAASSNLLSNCTAFLKAHKTKMVLCTAAVCVLAVCYKKPEMLTNLKGMFIGLCEKASGFVMGK